MERKELWVPLAVLGLTALFAVVSLGVRATRGRSHWLIRRKLAVGAALLSLTWVASGCDDGLPVSCYDPGMPDDFFDFDSEFFNDDGLFELDLAEGSAITGTIENRTRSLYSFVLLDSEEEFLSMGTILPADGAFDTGTEDFTLDLGQDLTPGVYLLRYGPGTSDDVDSAGRQRRFTVVDSTP